MIPVGKSARRQLIFVLPTRVKAYHASRCNGKRGLLLSGSKTAFCRRSLRLSRIRVILGHDSVTANDSRTLTAKDHLDSLHARMRCACARSERDLSSISLVGAAKTVAVERLREFLHAGLVEVGENYVQEGMTKIAALESDAGRARWHLIGALQSNKARQAASAFSVIHSVDRASLAQALDRAAQDIGKVQDVLLQVNLGDEAGKAGCAPQELENLARACAKLTNVRVCGLMCLPPYDPVAEYSRPYFRQLRTLRDVLMGNELLRPETAELSMGMSNNFEVAIEEGATLIRIGTALFGQRHK